MRTVTAATRSGGGTAARHTVWTDSIVDRFEAAVRRAPDALALTGVADDGPDTQVSYAALDRVAARGARRLRARGIGEEQIVAVVVGHDVTTIAAVLAVMKAGACLLPLDPALPKARLARILEESRPALLASPAADCARYGVHGVQTAAFESWLWTPERAEEAAAVFSPRTLTPEHAVYVIYTSGSSGEPKGVVVTHGGLSNHCESISRIVSLTGGDRVLQFASLAFDAAYEEIVPTLCAGAHLTLRSTTMGEDIGTLLAECHRRQITIIDIPTALWHVLTPMLRSTATHVPDALRGIIIGGEEASPAHLSYWRNLERPGFWILNTYGPTETTIIVTACDLLARPACSVDIPLGAALPRTSLTLRDGAAICPPDRVGEIHIGGAGVARGYLHAPRLTADRFIPDASGGGRVYRTGDLATFTSGGDLLFKGRTDHQVKLNGQRIQLEEVEAALQSHPSIAACAVLLRDNRLGGKHLVAYCMLERGDRSLPFEQTPLSVTGLRDYLRGRLPEYMLPGEFSFLEKFLLTPSGKIDRARLPEIGHFDREVRRLPDYQRPRPGLEAQLAAIWCEVLDLEAHEISAEDPFEFLGGNSLYSIQVRYKAHDAGLLFKASDMHLRQTIRGLAASTRTAATPLVRAAHAVLDHVNYVRGLGRVVAMDLRRRATPLRAMRGSASRRALTRFYASLPRQDDAFYLFFTTHQLHWLHTTASYVPKTCNLVLIGAGLSREEIEWVQRRIDRPFLPLARHIDLDMIWDILFDVNTRNFGWLDVDCLIMNPSIFEEMRRISPDEAISCLWTHAACGPTKRPFHAIETYCLFFNIAVIDGLRKSGLLPRPSQRTATVGQLDLVKRLIPATEEQQAQFETLSGRAFTHRLYNFDFDPLILFQLVANASGYRLNRVRFFTEIDTFNPYNYYSDEAIHVFPSIRDYDQYEWAGFEQQVRLATDYLLMMSLFELLPPSYEARRRFLESKFPHFNLDLRVMQIEIKKYLGERGVTEKTFSQEQFRWLTAEAVAHAARPPAARARTVAALS